MCTAFGCTDIEWESLVSGINSVPVSKLRKTCLYLKITAGPTLPEYAWSYGEYFQHGSELTETEDEGEKSCSF